MPDNGYMLEIGCGDQHGVETRVLHPPGVRVECGQDDMRDVFHRVAVGHQVGLDADEGREPETGVRNVAAEVDVDPIQVGEVFYVCAVEDGHEAVVVPGQYRQRLPALDEAAPGRDDEEGPHVLRGPEVGLEV